MCREYHNVAFRKIVVRCLFCWGGKGFPRNPPQLTWRDFACPRRSAQDASLPPKTLPATEKKLRRQGGIEIGVEFLAEIGAEIGTEIAAESSLKSAPNSAPNLIN